MIPIMSPLQFEFSVDSISVSHLGRPSEHLREIELLVVKVVHDPRPRHFLFIVIHYCQVQVREYVSIVVICHGHYIQPESIY